MPHIITAVSGIAKRAGIRSGDVLLRINREPVIDFLDYQALTAEKKLLLTLRRSDRVYETRLTKPEYADAGLEFASPMMSNVRLCCNKCLFCFVDQLPPCARDSLRVKDDDWRMSLMMGNYVTLTNVPMEGIRRIIKRHASPLYISVHTMNPTLRESMMGTPRARLLPDQLRALADGGISFHCQAVLCPGINDADVLDETIRQLQDYRPHALSLALVPVGLTGFREGLTDLRPYTKEEARAVIALADKWRAKLLAKTGTRFVFPSDEFYVTAQLPLPQEDAYEEFGQIDDGVGMLRLFESEYAQAYQEAGLSHQGQAGIIGTPIALACGKSAEGFFRALLTAYPPPGANVTIHGVENRFFGPTVTVSALLTGGDLLREFQEDPAKKILIPDTMLRPEDQRFLDDMTLQELMDRLGKPVIPVGRNGGALLEAIRTESEDGRN